MEINAEAMALLVNRDNVLWKFFEAKHSLVFLPVDLETAIWEKLKRIAQFHILSKHFLLIKILPAKKLS